MVVIHVKQGGENEFLFETTCKESNDVLIRKMAKVCNMRMCLLRLADAARELGKHGPSKKPEAQGLDQIQEEAGETVDKGKFYVADPSGYRTGNGPGHRAADTLNKVADDAVAVCNKLQVTKKIALSEDLLQEKFDLIRGAVMMAYPMGLPVYDPITQMLEDTENPGEGAASMEYMDPSSCSLWWAGKEFFRDQAVGDRLGRNEKTKIVAKLQKQGSGAPAREPGVSEDERKAMMAHYFKKQEEMKRLAEADSEDYLTSSWANPQGMKDSMRGTGGISYRPGGKLM
jgi:hypothetical protein